MVAIKVYSTNGNVHYLDLPAGVKLNFEELKSAFDRNLEEGLFSFPIDVPFTPANLNFFKHLQHMNAHSATIPDYWRCDVEEYGVAELVDCKLKIINHKGRWDNKTGFISTMITGAKGMFGTLIKNKKLTDLQLGGKITWAPTSDSREFAKEVMDGLHPTVADKLGFAPVAMEDYFDTTREDYNGEVLHVPIVNNTILNGAYNNGWLFGRNATVNTKVNKNNAGYEEYRTVPFLKLFFVLKQIGLEFGYQVSGEFFQFPGFSKLHVFNQRSVERYDFPFLFDVNTEINPVDHVPEMLIVDFLIAFQNAFNLRIDFLPNQIIEFNFNHNILNATNRVDYTKKCLSVYPEASRSESFENGYTLKWGWDSNDSYAREKIKKQKDLNVIATVTLFSDIAGLSFAFTLDETHYILVTAENYFYNYVTSSGDWIPVFENNEELVIGKGSEAVEPAISPLSSYYTVDGTGTYTRRNIVATRQLGSYWNNGKTLVKNPFGLRLLYIGTITTGSFTNLPISFCHNYDADGKKLAEVSLNWHTKEGVYTLFYKQWLAMLMESWTVKARFQLDRVEIYNFKKTDVMLINGSQFIVRKQAYSLPMNEATEVELVKV